MNLSMNEYELESLFEFEDEWEGEWEDEYESEEFFRTLSGLASRAARSPALRRVGLAAARSALQGMGPVGGIIGGALPQSEYEFEDEFEFEDEYEYEFELDREVNPIQRAYPNALMEHLGHAAAAAESEEEAEAFIGALVPLAAQLLPQVGSAVMRAAPGLIRGLAGATRTLRRNPQTRPLVRTLPTVMRRTAASMAQQSAQGRPVTPQRAVQTLARQTAQVVGNPQQATQAFRRSQTADRRYHQGARPAARPRPAQRRCVCR
jgi:hypothetical protein